jgi:hypothetical protein
MYHRATILSGLTGLALLGPVALRADRGSIPFTHGVQIFEPMQRALIAWNGEEEILLLSTDLRASEPTKVLEVLPLPAEPKVTKGDTDVFRRATALINRRLMEQVRADAKGQREITAAPAGEVTFHERIGAHDISVVRADQADGFVDWVNAYLKKAGVANPQIPEPLKEAIGAYLKDGYTWFVFDVVELGTDVRTNDAIQYRFASKTLYYPLRISRTDHGETVIQLMVLTPRLLSRFPGLPIEQVRPSHTPVSITSVELNEISPEMNQLLGHRPEQKLRIWEIRGRLQEFQADLIAS